MSVLNELANICQTHPNSTQSVPTQQVGVFVGHSEFPVRDIFVWRINRFLEGNGYWLTKAEEAGQEGLDFLNKEVEEYWKKVRQ